MSNTSMVTDQSFPPALVGLARSLIKENDTELWLVLADALGDLSDEELHWREHALSHIKHQVGYCCPHPRGCWLLRHLLGEVKESPHYRADGWTDPVETLDVLLDRENAIRFAERSKCYEG